MRVIEPINPKKPELETITEETRIPPKRRHKRKFIIFCFMVFVLLAAVVIVLAGKAQAPNSTSIKSEPKNNVPEIGTQADTKPKQLAVFTPDQFKELYDSIAYPNTTAIQTPPTITGNEAADDRMRQIAEKRGYKLRSIPVSPIVKIGDPNLGDDDLLQEKALEGWKLLKAAANSEGLPLRIVSGYRSPQLQRSIFVSRYNDTGGTAAAAASGQADSIINAILITSALPGYSRHHTGYTIDLQCNNGSLEAFVTSPCFTWISRNNYENAKKTGWIPSYPEGAAQQGPEPEPWEYVWVGVDAVMK